MTNNQNHQRQHQDTTTWNTWMHVVAANEPYIEEGQYKADLIDVRLTRSKNANRPQVDVTYQIENSTKRIHSYYVLDSEDGTRHLKRWATILGFRLPNHPGDLRETLEEIVKQQPTCLIQVIDNDGFCFALILETIDPEPVLVGNEDPASSPSQGAAMPLCNGEDFS